MNAQILMFWKNKITSELLLKTVITKFGSAQGEGHRIPRKSKYATGRWVLTDHCTPISDNVFRQRLRSASSHQVSVPHYRLSTYGHRAFSVAGPTVRNSLPEDMECSVDGYRQSLKTFLFSQY